MRNRKITLLGPEGTNISIFFLFLVFNFISWFTLFTLSADINLDFSNIKYNVESLKGIYNRYDGGDSQGVVN